MKTTLHWKTGLEFEAEIGQHRLTLDSRPPLGKDAGPTPKELVVAGLAGCTAMDVVALLKKYKQTADSVSVSSEVMTSEAGKHPIVFTSAQIVCDVTGSVDAEKLKEAVVLSQTKFCGVSAMFAELFPVNWKIILNGTEIAQGSAQFD